MSTFNPFLNLLIIYPSVKVH